MLIEAVGTPTGVQPEVHFQVAHRLLKEGHAVRAFAELMRAARTAPMSGRSAALLGRAAVAAGTPPAAVATLRDAVARNQGLTRRRAQFALIRLLRKTDQIEAAREELALLLAEHPKSRPGRALLNAVLEMEHRWEELDASLEREASDAVRRGAFVRQSRALLRRARLHTDRLKSPAKAAELFRDAAHASYLAGRSQSEFALRLLALRAMGRTRTSAEALSEAADAVRAAAKRVGEEDRAERLIAELRNKSPRRSTTQVEFMAVAVQTDEKSAGHEAEALLSAAAQEVPDAGAERKLEAMLVGRRAWRELAQFYRDHAARAVPGPARAESLEKLAELLESELKDPHGAARAWGELESLTGDRRAQDARVRLLQDAGEFSSVRRVLDESVGAASDSGVRADARVRRAEVAMLSGDFEAAQADFEAAIELKPGHAAAWVGVCELAAAQAKDIPAGPLKDAMRRLKKRQEGRAELFRRFARLLESPLGDLEAAAQAWGQVRFELPEDAEALARGESLARRQGDSALLEALLRERLSSQKRGTLARTGFREWAQLCRARGDDAAAIEVLKQALRAEPAHMEAWLLYVEIQSEAGNAKEELRGLEHAAGLTTDTLERARLWRRLETLARGPLKDPARADGFRQKALRIENELAQPEEVSDSAIEEIEEEVSAESDDEASRVSEPPRQKASLKDNDERMWVLSKLRQSPLEAGLYERLSKVFAKANDHARASLMLEVAQALAGTDELRASPPLLLGATDRLGLRHPLLRGTEGEFFRIVGKALLHAVHSDKSVEGAPVEWTQGPGVPAVAAALLDAIRILGLSCPAPKVSAADGPPFMLAFAGGPQLSVGKAALRKPLPADELRFFAGRALFALNEDLMVLRGLTKEQLARGLRALDEALERPLGAGPSAKALQTFLTPSMTKHVRALQTPFKPDRLAQLEEAARHSVNRAGLVVAGGLGPALRALRAKKALLSEQVALVRFASSERYFQLRTRTLS